MAEVAEYSGLDKGKFQLWNSRYSLTGFDKDPLGGGKRGQARTFRFEHVMEYAIAKEFVDAGLPPRKAFLDAAKFAYFGFVGNDAEPERHPSLPFHESFGQTLFAVSEDKFWLGCWKPSDKFVLDEFFTRLGGTSGWASHCTIINASIVFNRVCNRMGVYAYEILDAEYQRT